ncbi:hypothetical protein F7725_006284, partial [Dissostichus mawsoni]
GFGTSRKISFLPLKQRDFTEGVTAAAANGANGANAASFTQSLNTMDGRSYASGSGGFDLYGGGYKDSMSGLGGYGGGRRWRRRPYEEGAFRNLPDLLHRNTCRCSHRKNQPASGHADSAGGGAERVPRRQILCWELWLRWPRGWDAAESERKLRLWGRQNATEYEGVVQPGRRRRRRGGWTGRRSPRRGGGTGGFANRRSDPPPLGGVGEGGETLLLSGGGSRQAALPPGQPHRGFQQQDIPGRHFGGGPRAGRQRGRKRPLNKVKPAEKNGDDSETTPAVEVFKAPVDADNASPEQKEEKSPAGKQSPSPGQDNTQDEEEEGLPGEEYLQNKFKKTDQRVGQLENHSAAICQCTESRTSPR